jgi:hypothetical protein
MQEQEPIIPPEEEQAGRLQLVFNQVWHWFKRLLTWAAVLLLLLLGVLQLPAVQNWIAEKVTRSLSESMETTVSVDRLHIAFLDRLVLEGFYVQDVNPEDTALYSRRLYADISLSPLGYLRRGLVIEEVELDSATFNLRTPEGSQQTNIQILLGRLLEPDSSQLEEDKRPFRFDVEQLKLSRVRFLKENQVRGQVMDIFLEAGQATFHDFDLPQQTVHAETVILEKPVVNIHNYPEKPIVTAEGDTLDPWAEPPASPVAIQQPPFYGTIGKLRLEGGRFSLHNWRNAPVKTSPEDELDYQHMEVYDINIGIDYFSFCSDSLDFEGQVKQFALKDSSGFVLENLSVQDGRVWSKGLELYDMKLKTPYSEIGDTLAFRYGTYEDFKDFPTAVDMEGQLNASTVTLRDIMTFAPKLKENQFFQDNRNRKLYVDGLFKGEVNNLDARNMYIALEDRSLVVEGNLRTTNLVQQSGRIINLNLDLLRTNVRTLRQLFPGFQPPESFGRLGWLNFQGNFDLVFSDYIAYGELNSALGRARLDMQVSNLNAGREQATYRGDLSLIDFDLGGFTQNPNLGLVNFTSQVRNGEGLTAAAARADLEAEVKSFLFKGYKYENAKLTGELRRNLFRGDFAIQDENIDFEFHGTVDMADSIPRFNFAASVNRLVMQALNLSEKDILLSGKIDLDLKNKSLSTVEGDGLVKDFVLRHSRQDTSVKIGVDSVFFTSAFQADGQKRFRIQSDLLEAELLGNFDVEQVPAAFMEYLRRNYPEYFQRLGLKPPKLAIRDNRFQYSVKILDTKGLLSVFAPKLDRIEGAELDGYFDSTRDSIYLLGYFPHFQYGNVALDELALQLRMEDSLGSLDLLVEEPVLNEHNQLSPIQLLANIEKDTLDLAMAYQSDGLSMLDKLNLNAQLFLRDSLNYQLKFKRSNLVIMEVPWLIDEDNSITFRKGYVDTDNFLLTNRDREVKLQSYEEKGLQLDLYNFDFSFIDDVWDYDELDFSGSFDLQVKVDNIFEMDGLGANLTADTFLVNEEDWGALSLETSAQNLRKPYEAYLSITKDTAQLIAEGYYNPQEQRGAWRGKEELQAQYFDFDLDVTSFPMRIAEYWIGSSVSNTVGRFDTRLDIYGQPGDPHVDGMIYVRDGATTVDFLQTRYFFEEGEIIANDYLFDASGNTVRDKYGNEARIRGGITHDKLQDLGIEATLSTSRFLALDTDKDDNELFYGHAIGKGDVIFDGPFSAVDIYVNATVGNETRLVIPVGAGSDASELQFINFQERKKPADLEERAASVKESLTGVNLEMDLIITEEARGEIIFDEQAGDIIKGKGRGNIRILVPRSGEFQMFGDYVIEEGDYLFTLYNVVNKDFEIKQGGTITWSGDPFEAQINLEAEYTGLSTPVANFVQEYLVNAPDQLQQDASQATDVDLTMLLRGDLLKPVINFDIQFPELTGGLKTLTDSKLRILQQDPNELNRQVFGLIVVGQFLPSDLAIQGTDIFYNTVSEFVSNQLSLLLTELFSEFFSEGNTLSGIDFDIAYNQYQATLGESQDFRRGDEFQVQLRQNFFDDRLSILVGGNVDIGNSARVPDASGTFLGNDVVIEYYLNNDRSLKLRVYQRREPDVGGGSRLEIGTGLSYRKEFDTFGAFLRSFRKDAERVKD